MAGVPSSSSAAVHNQAAALSNSGGVETQKVTTGEDESNLPPLGTFERTTFSQILAHYDQRHSLPPTLEHAQALLMTQNFKEAAARMVTGSGST